MCENSYSSSSGGPKHGAHNTVANQMPTPTKLVFGVRLTHVKKRNEMISLASHGREKIM